MKLPCTMDVAQAADGVNASQPTHVCSYHHRNSDVEFAAMVEAPTEVRMGPWYEGDLP